MSLALLLAQAAPAAATSGDHSLLLGTGGVAGVLAIGVVALWKELRDQRVEHKTELAAANAKLDKFQDERIKELGELTKALTGTGGSSGGH